MITQIFYIYSLKAEDEAEKEIVSAYRTLREARLHIVDRCRANEGKNYWHLMFDKGDFGMYAMSEGGEIMRIGAVALRKYASEVSYIDLGEA